MSIPQIITVNQDGSTSLPGFLYPDTFLMVNPDVVLTVDLANSIQATRPWFQQSTIVGAKVTSGYRPPTRQVMTILDYGHKKGFLDLFQEVKDGIANNWGPDIKVPMTIPGLPITSVYWWQRLWTRLLASGTIINPAYDCIFLEHSSRPDGSDRFGSTFKQTVHAKYGAFDVGGASGDPGPDDEVRVLNEAKADPGCKIRDVVLEHDNNCCHVGIILT